ncbi:E3 ubiquitin-protein ligase rnf213-alpha-like isoform X4 [Dreissena polymorpha]|nr:E3 ubiquitin-protein ligase rnf213-alpha-like isoform X4 [Dreissena polymorpha]
MKCTNCGKDGSEPLCAECHAKKEPDVYCEDIEGEKDTIWNAEFPCTMKCTNCGKDGSEPLCAECHAKKEPDVYCEDIEGEKDTIWNAEFPCTMKCTNCGKDGSEPLCAECHAKKEPDVYCKDIEGEKVSTQDGFSVENRASVLRKESNDNKEREPRTDTKDNVKEDSIKLNNDDQDDLHGRESEDYFSCESDFYEDALSDALSISSDTPDTYQCEAIHSGKSIEDMKTGTSKEEKFTEPDAHEIPHLNKEDDLLEHPTVTQTDFQISERETDQSDKSVERISVYNRTSGKKFQTNVDTFQTEAIGDLHNEQRRFKTTENSTEKKAFLTVNFHAYVSSQMFENAEERLYIKFDFEELGGWGSFNHEMKKVGSTKKIDAQFIEYEYSLPVQCTLLKKNIRYKYVVFNWTSRKESYEKYKSDTKYCNRTLNVHREFAFTKGVWRQYDGKIVPEVGRLHKYYLMVFSSENTFVKGYVKDLTPSLFTTTLITVNKSSIRNDIENFIMLLDGVCRVFVADMKCWKSDQDFHKEVTEKLLLTNLIKEMSKPLSKQSSTDRVLQALSVVVVCERVGIPLNSSNWENLCKCLILSLDSKNTHVVEIESVQSHFEERQIQSALIYLMNSFLKYDTKEVKPFWLCCVPLFHITYGICTPFKEPDHELSIGSDLWWGTNEISDVAKYTFQESGRSIHLDVINLLKPLYKMDYFLPRTIAQTIPFNNSCVLSCDLSLDSVCARLLQEARSGKSQTIMEEAYQNVIIRLQSNFDEDHRSEGSCWVAYQLAYSLVAGQSDKHDPDLLLNFLHIFLHCVARYDILLKNENLESKINSENTKQNEHFEYLINIADLCLGQLSKMHYRNLVEYLKIWNLAFPEMLQSETVLSIWINKASTIFKDSLLDRIKNTETVVFLEHYCSEEGKYSLPIQTCLSEVAFEVIESGKMTLNHSSISKSVIPKYAALLSRLFLKHWGSSSTTDEESVLEHALKWVPMKQFIENHRQMDDLLNKPARHKLSETCRVLKKIGKLVIKGTGTVHLLEIVCAQCTQFCDIFECFYENIALHIELRKKELQAFKNEAGLMSEFVNTCHQDQVDEIKDVLKMELKDQQMCKLCKIGDITTEINAYKPEVIAFNCSPHVVLILDKFYECQKSFLFRNFWEQRRLFLNTRGLSTEEIVNDVWNPVVKKWRSFGRKMESGELLFRKFEINLGRMFENDEERLTNEIMVLGLDRKTTMDIIESYKNLKKIESSIANAKLILDFKHTFDLHGDFSAVEQISNFAEQEFKLKGVNENLMRSCTGLTEITANERDCLTAFVQCEPLITWLQASMAEAGRKELKVFTDLAMMSAGDEPMNIGKVQCLHSAVTSYSPLIFELNKTCDYTQLLDKCKFVFEELKANPLLPRQIIDTNGQLDWLKDIKKAHGSVEVTSLMLAEAINSDGMYIVGNAEEGYKGENEVDYEILRLVVPEKDGKRQPRSYTLSEVQDLHSRLMLVSGENADDTIEKEVDVDMFTLIFDSVSRVGNVYQKLCESGCVLFYNFKAEFMCNTTHTSRPVCVNLEFSDRNDTLILKGRKSEKEGLKEIIPEIAKFMEQCLKTWLQYIKTKREEYSYLNYFTIGQLIILQRELVKMEGMMSNDVYPLLTTVRKACSPDALKLAMSTAGIEAERKSKMHTSFSTSSTSSMHEELSTIETEFVNKLVLNAKISDVLARKSLQHVDRKDIESLNTKAAMLWCMKQRGIERTVVAKKETTQAITKTWGFLANYRTVTSANGSQTNNVGCVPLISDLQQCWESFLGSVSAPNSDFLSLEHLGIVLQHLAQGDDLNRTLPGHLNEGHPYLIMCKTDELLLVTISIYMHEDTKPLPCSDEVLLCTEYTSSDEVEIFLRRSMLSASGKIHCLVNADALGYETSAMAIQFINENVQKAIKTGPYRLFIICDSRNENWSRFGIALHKYLHRMQPVDTQKVKLYVTKHLTVANRRLDCAASMDFNNSSTRLIKSSRFGVGKSLYVKRVGERLVSEAAKQNVETTIVRIPLQEKRININEIVQLLREHTPVPGKKSARLFHIDISTKVEEGIDFLLFNLLILKCVVDKQGYVWRREDNDLYLIEVIPEMQTCDKNSVPYYKNSVYGILPDVACKSPKESMDVYEHDRNSEQKGNPPDQVFDDTVFRSSDFQRTFQYLLKLEKENSMLEVDATKIVGSPADCLAVLMRRCGVVNPSWSELYHFVLFLNTQLVDYEQNQFVTRAAEEDLPGFSTFVLRSLIQMSKDFSTRSLAIAEESFDDTFNIESNHDSDDESDNDDISSLHNIMELYNIDDDSDSDDSSADNSIEPSSDSDDLGARDDIQDVAEQQPVNGILFENSSENSSDDEGEQSTGGENNELSRYELRRTWETSPHPYIFFNFDRLSFTFLGFNIDNKGNLIDVQTGHVLERRIMRKRLMISLIENDVPLSEEASDDEDNDQRMEYIKRLCSVMGVQNIHDPDPTYELTMDNMKKILAIYMRFRCGIPVIIMGETGCGKTRLVKFMCALQCPLNVPATNLKLVKVHGGTTKNAIKEIVHQAEAIAKKNVKEFGEQMYTVLFFDEANTTEATGIFKEIMCDQSICGKSIQMYRNLKIIAACNPYRKHSDRFVKNLENAGLGYHVDANETRDTLGKIPMRRLVYRVQPLPESLLPLVWDFGQLNAEVERLYIYQIVKRFIMLNHFVQECDGEIKDDVIESLCDMLASSQQFMRNQKDECGFVSLRDIERFLRVMTWFSKIGEHLFPLMEAKLLQNGVIEENKVDSFARSAILALGVCYHACLKDRNAFRTMITGFCNLPGGADRMLQEIESCQDVFLDNVSLDKNIARNTALRENIFMMVVCIELRIPLFLVGKPGSSKSLAKTIVADAMQGNLSRSALFKHFKQVQMVTFQCSPLATSEGIIGTFKQCARFQKDKDLDKFVSVVVLEEIGLAEDVPQMPLKTLHPLLEDGCVEDETPENYKKVAFIGISNWALDPAKMNRGILVQREVPDLTELQNSARGICNATDDLYQIFIKQWIEPLARGYDDVFKLASTKREFFGLRDFYSVVKMVFKFVNERKTQPSRFQIVHAIKRNFGGLDTLEPDHYFMEYLCKDFREPSSDDPDCSAKGLVEASLSESRKSGTVSRYLLLLTENYGALSMIRQQFFKDEDKRPVIIFGSNFRSDREYTQVCRNINKIKVCMGTGKTVILLNLDNLYESLYDALNQNYVYFGGERYVDLGLGTHRVKCPVHRNFRLIVVAEKQTVYTKFPIPLINRLEKHIITGTTMLDERHKFLAKDLQTWTINVLGTNSFDKSINTDVIIGFHDDACSASIMYVIDQLKTRNSEDNEVSESEILEQAKQLLLWCATPESLLLNNQSQMEQLRDVYYYQQEHGSLLSYLYNMIVEKSVKPLFAQITCHSKLLPDNYSCEITKRISSIEHVVILSLCAFDSEHEFCTHIRRFLESATTYRLLIIQCYSGDKNSELIACAENCVLEEFEKQRINPLKSDIHIAFIIQLPRKVDGCFSGYQCGIWRCVHIDDLYEAEQGFPKLTDLFGKTIGQLLLSTVSNKRLSVEYEDSSTTVCGKRCVRIDGLIKQAVPLALSMIHDRLQEEQRATKRLDVVLKCLQSPDVSELFMRAISKTVANIITTKEDHQEGFKARQWISRVANSKEAIYQNGTFRQACYQTTKLKIAPVLAHIIAFLDTNCNLELALSEVPWKRDFWLRCCADSKIVHIKYDDLLSPHERKEIMEIVVPTVGYENHAFKLRFPFSWLIIHMTESLFRDSLNENNSEVSKDRINLCSRLLNGGIFGQALTSLDKEQHQQEILNDFIHDFVHVVYNPKNGESEQTLVEDVIKSRAELFRKSCKQTKDVPYLIQCIVCVRFAFETESIRLKNFRGINEIWPSCSIEIATLQMYSPEFLYSDNKLLRTVGQLIANMEPQFIQNDYSSRSEWLSKVYRSRHIVEQVFTLCQEDSDVHLEMYSQTRSAWNRVLTMKLFIENLFPNDKEDILTNEECNVMWNILDEDVDMKELTSFKTLQEFLRECNEIALSKTIGVGRTCSRCEVEVTMPPTVLPCSTNHVLCERCYLEIKKDLKQCPQCKEMFKDKRETSEIDRNQVARLEVFQKRCNTFFVDVVTQLCFSDEVPPSRDVLTQLFGHVICSSESGGKTFTKDLSLYDSGLDPNPVFRCFLLQLIFKFSVTDSVTEYIHQFIKTAGNEDANLMEIYLIIVQCYENFRRGILNKDENCNYIEVCKWMAESQYPFLAIGNQSKNETVTKLLCCIADVRVGLGIAAECMAYGVLKKDDFHMGHVPPIIHKVREFCESIHTDCPRVFLAKQLCHGFGIEVYQRVCNSPNGMLNWLAYNSEGNLMADCDRYIVCGSTYSDIREAVSKCLLNSTEITNLKLLLEQLQTGDSTWVLFLLLAVHRLVTCANVWNTKQNLENKDKLYQFFDHDLFSNDKELLMQLFHNDLQPGCLKIVSRTDTFYYGLQCLLTHFKFVLLACKENGTHLMNPFVELSNGDEDIEMMFLPAMEDPIENHPILHAAASEEHVYLCPNGHPYLIGECGRPWTKSKCTDCGATIGGESHRRYKNNKHDTSAVGHTLGNADKNTGNSTRDLDPIYCNVIRLLVHMAMYLGPVEMIKRIIRPSLQDDEVSAFVLEHITRNVHDLEQLLACRTDDVFLLIHYLVDKMLILREETLTYSDLSTRTERNEWEKEFSEHVLHDVLSNLGILTDLNKKLVKDLRPGDPLMSRIYERDGSEHDELPNNLLEDSRMWMYRKPTTIEDMRQKLEYVCRNVKRYPVLQLFMNEDEHLQALRYVPNIINLVRALLNRYLKKIDKLEALTMTVRTIKKDFPAPEVQKWLDDFAKAWEITRNNLHVHGCRTEFGTANCQKFLCDQSIDDNTPLAIFLPTVDGPGLCSYAMLDFLFRKQNALLDDYIRMAAITDIKHPFVSPMAVSSTHLISYDHDHDIMPLVLANCRYSFEVGDQTKIEYDFDGMERQLMDRLLNSKSKIVINKYLQIDTMVYRTEISNSAVMRKLHFKIPQEPLNITVRSQILEEFSDVTDACTSIDNLDIAISFLKTIGGEPIVSLTRFMTDTIKMQNPIHGQKVHQFCQLKHAKALWLLLSFQRTQLLIDCLQGVKTIENAFNTLRPQHFKKIPADSKAAFTKYLESFSCERLFHIMEILHEFLLLKVAVKENADSEDYVETDNFGLFDGLVAYNNDLETTDFDSDLLEGAPSYILYKHSAAAWEEIYNTFKKKKDGIRL